MGKVTTFWEQMELVFNLPDPVPASPAIAAATDDNPLPFWRAVMAVPVIVLSAAYAGLTDGRNPCNACAGKACFELVEEGKKPVVARKRCLALEAYMAGMSRRFEGEAERSSSLGGDEYGIAS